MSPAPRQGHPRARPLVGATLAALLLTIPLAGAAAADETPSPTPGSGTSTSDQHPSKRQLDRARKNVADKQRSVDQLQAALVAAQAELDAAITAAEVAAENYNGALWQLAEARKASRQAQLDAQHAADEVESQRHAIATLVAESYQNGTELTTATALVSEDGPEGLMNRYGVVQSAGDSMDARYQEFRVALAKAETYAAQAAKAQQRQKALAKQAREMRTAAAQAAEQAGAAANAIAAQRAQLIVQLAKAQNISLDLAKERQAYLERQAAQKAAAAAAAEHEAREARLLEQAKQAAKQAAQQKRENKNQPKPVSPSATNPVRPPSAAPPVDPSPPSSNSSAVSKAIAYAKAQLGKPYKWGAAGPSSFDCSGLTMRAWQAGGKSLPHYSVAQSQSGTRISVAAAKAGDLYFWSDNGSPSGIHHVALALGGGQFIEAPRTGLSVRYNSVYNWYPDFAVRL